MSRYNIDIRANRSKKKYTSKELLLRFLWNLIKPLYHYSPRTFFGWRAFLLIFFGAKVGRKTHIYNSATIYCPWNLEIGNYSAIGEHAYIYNLGPITIGDRVTISQRAHLCAGTHDYNNPNLPLIKSPIVVKNQAWVCADAFIGPNVVVGEGAIVGACAVVTKRVDSWSIVAGNPAKYIKQRMLKSI